MQKEAPTTLESNKDGVLSELDSQLQKIEKKDFPIATFDETLNKLVKSPENIQKLFDATRSSLQTLDVTATSKEIKTHAKDLLNWLYGQLPKEMQATEYMNLVDLNVKINDNPEVADLITDMKKKTSDANSNPSESVVNLWTINQKSLTEDLQQNFNEVIKQYGSTLLTVFELFGGKGALRWFCNTFHLDYDKNFSSVEKLYDDVYKLDAPQTEALDFVYKDTTNFVWDDWIAKDLRCDKKAVESYYQTWWQNNFELLDPVLVSRAMKQTKIDIPNLLVPAGSQYGETVYKINIDVLDAADSDQIEKIVTEILKDTSLWGSVKTLRSETTAASVYGKEHSESRWNKKSPSSAKDAAVAFGACLMKGSKDLKYVISQNTIPYEADHKDGQNAEQMKTKIEADWKLFVNDCDPEKGKRKWFPLEESKILPEQKDAYKEYTDAVVQHLNALFADKSPDLSTLNVNLYLKGQLNKLLPKQVWVYLNALDKDILLSSDDKTNVKKSLAALNSIIVDEHDPHIDFDVGVISISGKNKDKEDVVIKSTDFTWIKPASPITYSEDYVAASKAKKGPIRPDVVV